jgi:6-phosphogluconate dehydrogenase (decarboxylating)
MAVCCGLGGVGHIIKMVQSGIEYGITAAHAEWLRVLREANAGKLPRALNIGELRRRGGVTGQRPRTLEFALQSQTRPTERPPPRRGFRASRPATRFSSHG